MPKIDHTCSASAKLPDNLKDQIAFVEEELRQAMLASDVNTLNRLISDDLVFTDHLGQLLTKQSDLEVHRSGILNFSTLEPSEQFLKANDEIVIVSVRMKTSGTYSGEPFTIDLRFTRIWQRAEGRGWRVVAGHSSAIQG